ncbi:MAG TPA: type II toxin-antitoxin system prevent-host-death family antitoxin [Candidatus Acidoferrum sp.]|nr:type II toxin-antitoxin system prevent-host-death family antitoxin [Candidatus Acidoferrum sp.]
MKSVGVYEAKTQLPRLLNRVARGERITITRHGVPVAVIVPPDGHAKRPLGDVIAELEAFGRGRKLRSLSMRTLIASGRR